METKRIKALMDEGKKFYKVGLVGSRNLDGTPKYEMPHIVLNDGHEDPQNIKKSNLGSFPVIGVEMENGVYDAFTGEIISSEVCEGLCYSDLLEMSNEELEWHLLNIKGRYLDEEKANVTRYKISLGEMATYIANMVKYGYIKRK